LITLTLFFLKSLQSHRYLIWTGLVVGLGALAKYTVFISVPIILVYLLLFRRNYFQEKLLERLTDRRNRVTISDDVVRERTAGAEKVGIIIGRW
jgi:hypothetical protein